MGRVEGAAPGEPPGLICLAAMPRWPVMILQESIHRLAAMAGWPAAGCSVHHLDMVQLLRFVKACCGHAARYPQRQLFVLCFLAPHD